MIYPLLFLVGYEELEVGEHDRERLVNLCSHFCIAYRVLSFDGGVLKIRLTLYSYLRLCVLCEKYGIEIKKLSSHGIPQLALRLLSRPGLVAGLAFCVFTAICSGSVIWDVRIEGNTQVPDKHITDTLQECGFGVGTKKEGLELDKIENHFLIISDEISWISVNVRGTVANVEVREAASAEKREDYAASNLVATKNGTVVGFEEVKGNIAVGIGDAVSRGGLLVGGVYGSEDTALRFVRSKGKVFALCETDFCISVPMKFEKKIYTGEQKIKKSLIFFEKEVKFFLNSGNSYASCDTIEGVEYFDIFGFGKIPIGIRTVKYVEYKIQETVRTEDEAEAQALFELWNGFYSNTNDATLVGKILQGSVQGDSYVLNATLKTVENIAYEQEIELNITG